MNLESCKNCKHYRRLKHNFKVGDGFEDSNCCVLFSEEAGGWIEEVKPNDCCEMITAREE